MTDKYIYIYMKNLQFDSLVWGSLTLAPIIVPTTLHLTFFEKNLTKDLQVYSKG